MLSISYSPCDSLSVITSYTTKIKGKPVHCEKAQVMNLNVWFTAQQSAWGWRWWLITSRVYTVTLKGWFWRTRNLDQLTSVQNRCGLLQGPLGVIWIGWNMKASHSKRTPWLAWQIRTEIIHDQLRYCKQVLILELPTSTGGIFFFSIANSSEEILAEILMHPWPT